MTRLTATAAVDMSAFDFTDLRDGLVASQTSTSWQVDANVFFHYAFTGTGLTYDASDRPNGGTITDFDFSQNGVVGLQIHGELSAAHLGAFVTNDDAQGFEEEWFAGNDRLTGSASNDHLLGFAGKDTFDLSVGGEDIAEGGEGDDTFLLGAALTDGDSIDGGADVDTVILDGNSFFTFKPDALVNVEIVRLNAGHTYDLTFKNSGGATNLTIDGSKLDSGDRLGVGVTGANAVHINGGNGDDFLGGGNGADVIGGNRGIDIIDGGNGADILIGGAGHDQFEYLRAQESTGLGFDTVTDLDLDGQDTFFTVSHIPRGVNAAVNHGHLSRAHFDADLAAAIGENQMHKFKAVLFTPDSGLFAGDAFIIIDDNGIGGYQAGQDIVVRVTGFTGEFDATDLMGQP